MQIQELMSRDIHYGAPEQPLDQIARMLWDFDCGALPVCSGDGAPRVVGMITDRDICMSALFQGKPLSAMQAGDAMNSEVRTCRPDASTADVERMMAEARIRRVPVTDGEGTLVGVISLADFAREARREQQTGVQDLTENEVTETLGTICEPGHTTAA